MLIKYHDVSYSALKEEVKINLGSTPPTEKFYATFNG